VSADGRLADQLSVGAQSAAGLPFAEPRDAAAARSRRVLPVRLSLTALCFLFLTDSVLHFSLHSFKFLKLFPKIISIETPVLFKSFHSSFIRRYVFVSKELTDRQIKNRFKDFNNRNQLYHRFTSLFVEHSNLD